MAQPGMTPEIAHSRCEPSIGRHSSYRRCYGPNVILEVVDRRAEGVAVMFGSMKRVAVSDLRIVRSLLMISTFGVLCCFTMVFCGMFVILGSFLVEFANLVCAHWMLQSQATSNPC